ncbi:SPOR domain-containing protein [Paraglaciecola arctica]|uniref:SPOR domain-containing protein n=1 Tax=Paraglaciecola arctica TaxID=1128911 RepID=UPI001C077C67|nr:SPOR domain-containing protein [Paraglaciecola arctica]MBU3003038.1 SPOR domain-containing protein [Paraglaciecola arctica]
MLANNKLGIMLINSKVRVLEMRNNMHKNVIIKLVFLSMSFVLSSCSSTPDFVEGDKNVNQSIALATSESATQSHSDEITIHLEEWRKMKPSIKRLVAIESELKELIVQLNAITQQQNVTTSDSQTKDASEVDVNIEQKEVTNNTVITSPAIPIDNTIQEPIHTVKKVEALSKKYGVQLGSLTDKQSLKTTWTGLMQKHSNVLAKLTPLYEEAIIGGKIYYRLKAGGLESQAKANELCNLLQTLNTSCFTTIFEGKAFL